LHFLPLFLFLPLRSFGAQGADGRWAIAFGKL
jgi:hypothetical protein